MYVLIVNEVSLGRHLAAALVALGHEVAYVDEEIEFCNMVSTEIGCLTIHGETTNVRVLQSAGIERADALVTLLDKDIKNILVALFARQFKVQRITARLVQEHYRAAYELAGIDTILSSFDYLLNELLMAVENPTIRRVMALGDGRIEMAAIDVSPESPFAGKTLEAIYSHPNFPQGALVLGLMHPHEQAFWLPHEESAVRPSDEVVVVGTPEHVQQIAAILGHPRRGFLRR